tara:strand:- start:7210 stop:8004 length:795 start_codon:yes stop_codon:yes gene_type:complete
MKIALGTNIFGNFHRQDLCIKSLKRLKKEYPDIIDLYNIQPTTDMQDEEGFTILPSLIKTSKDIIPNGKKTKPLMLEMFGSLSELEGYDYFIFTNSDIIISNRFIKLIINNPDYDSFSGSRLTILHIDTLDDEPTPIQYQIAGFDTFAIKTSWWNENKDKFPDYVYAEPCWDVHYATLLKKYGKSMFANKWPATLFHVFHEVAWASDTPELRYNETILIKQHNEDYELWNKFLFTVLMKRKPNNMFLKPIPNEEAMENTIFRHE